MNRRRYVLTLLELSGLACIVYGVGQLSVPAAWIVGGLLAVLSVYALERDLRK